MVENKNNLVLLHLALISGAGPITILKIIKKFFEEKFDAFDLTRLYDFVQSDFVKKIGLSEKLSKILFDGLKDKTLLEKELEFIAKYKIKFITILDSEYPKDLKAIYAPPIALFCKGASLGFFDKNIAIVGSRKSNTYAKEVIYKLVPDLITNGYKIVSGGALGVDSIAHQATLDFKGKTVVVLGSGLKYSYPMQNKDLFRKVVQDDGMLLSPFSFQTPPDKANFPARNRIIAGLSSGCLVVQAAKKSGALITAQFALENGRQVFAIPGSVYDDLSVGCHELIKQGAKLVTSVDDILEEFGQINCCKKENEDSKEEFVEKEKFFGIDDEQAKILQELSSVSSLDDLSIKTDLSIEMLQEKLFEMQLDGKVKQNFAGFWEQCD
jgi:DNA processing protein